VQPWRRAGKRMNIYYKAMLRSIAAHFNVSLESPWKNLPDDFKKVLLHGSGENEVDFHFWRAGSQHTIRRPFEGVLPNLERMFTGERKRIRPQPHQALHEPAILRCVQGQTAQTGNPGGDAGWHRPPACCFGRHARNCRGRTMAPRSSDNPQPASPDEIRRDAGATTKISNRKSEIGNRKFKIPGLSIMDVCALSVEKADEFFAGLKLTEFGRKSRMRSSRKSAPGSVF